MTNSLAKYPERHFREIFLHNQRVNGGQAIIIFRVAADLNYYHFSSYQWQNRLNAKPLCNLSFDLFPIVELYIFFYASICPKDITRVLEQSFGQ